MAETILKNYQMMLIDGEWYSATDDPEIFEQSPWEIDAEFEVLDGLEGFQ